MSAGLELRVLEDVRDRVDRAADHARLVELAVDVGGGPRSGPHGDDPVDLLLVLAAREVGGEARIVAQLGHGHGLAQSPKDAVGVGRDHHPLVVAGLEDVRGGDAFQAGAARAADDPSRSYSGTMLSSMA